ncbi:MAG: PGF-pre-PGF domain-containing protein [Haloarculaceae archaeon]
MRTTTRGLVAVYLAVLVGLATVAVNPGFVGVAAAGNTAPTCSTVGYAGAGNTASPYQVGDVDQLQCIDANHEEVDSRSAALDADYELTSDVDASETTDWHDGAGFSPIGSSEVKFTGTFDGNGHTISGLTIDRESTDDVGLFGYVDTGGTVQNVNLETVDTSGHDRVGALIGSNSGTVSQSNTSGTVSATGDSTGGLIGDNSGTVTRSYATDDVSATGDSAGGLVGDNSGTVTRSYTTGDVSASRYAGGLVGYDYDSGTVTQSYAIGTVSAIRYYAGGLVGAAFGTVSHSYATGAVGLTTYGGGLAGTTVIEGSGGSVEYSYWDKGTTYQIHPVGFGFLGTTNALTGYGSSDDPSPAPEMQGSSASSNMDNLDFTSTWETVPSGDRDTTDNGYPILQALDRSSQLQAQGIYNTPPSVSSISRDSPSSPTHDDSVEFTVTFSEDVSGVDTSDFTATQVSGDVTGTVSDVSGSDSSYTVTVSDIKHEGDLRLDLVDDDSITDDNGYELGGTGISGDGDGSYTSGESFTIESGGGGDEETPRTTATPTATATPAGKQRNVTPHESNDGAKSFDISGAKGGQTVVLAIGDSTTTKDNAGNSAPTPTGGSTPTGETTSTTAGGTTSTGTTTSESDGASQHGISFESMSMHLDKNVDSQIEVSIHEYEPSAGNAGEATTGNGRPANATTTPGESTTTPGESTTTPGESTTTGSGNNAAPDGVDPDSFLDETGASAARYIEVDHTNPDETIESATFRFRIRKDALAAQDTDPSDVAMYRNESGGWNKLPTTVVDETDTTYVFEADSPGLSMFTVGFTRPVFDVEAAAVQIEKALVSQPVVVDATVHNAGGKAGTHRVTLQVDGEIKASKLIDVPGQSNTSVSLTFAPEAIGKYDLSVETVRAGTVSVVNQADGTTTRTGGETSATTAGTTRSTAETTKSTVETTHATTTGTTAEGGNGNPTTTATTGTGFDAVVAVGALLAAALLALRRR